MKKTFKLKNLDCANCAAKMENGIKKLSGVKSASVNFMFQKLTIEADDDSFESVLQEAVSVCRKIEPDCVIVL